MMVQVLENNINQFLRKWLGWPYMAIKLHLPFRGIQNNLLLRGNDVQGFHRRKSGISRNHYQDQE